MAKYYDVAKLEYLEESDILLAITDFKTEVISLDTRLPMLVFKNSKFKDQGSSFLRIDDYTIYPHASASFYAENISLE